MKKMSLLGNLAAGSLCMMLLTLHASAQQVDSYSPADLAHRLDALKSKAAGSKAPALVTLEKYPNHYTMLIFRNSDGQAEVHTNVADVFIVVDGSATLLTGGTVIKPQPSGEGEIRGTSVEGGTPVQLAKGDIVHIPANVPHQLKLKPGGTFSYFVVKVTEK